MLVVFFGQPNVGKTTLCKKFFSHIRENMFVKIRIHYIDEYKFKSIYKFDTTEYQNRKKHIEAMSLANNVALYEDSLNDLVLLAFRYPYFQNRLQLSEMFGENILWVYLYTESTDIRGMHEEFITDFEEPTFDDTSGEYISISTTNFNEDECLNIVLNAYKGLLKK